MEGDECREACTTIKLWTPFCKDLNLDLKKSNIFHMMEFNIDPHARTVTKAVINDTINSEFAVMPPISSHVSSCRSLPSPLFSNHPESSNEYIVDGEITGTNSGASTKRTSSLSIHERYGFTAIFGDGDRFVGLAKWDMVKRRLDSTTYFDVNETGGEPIVVRATNTIDGNGSCIEEEIVYVGSYVYNEEEAQSYFLLFDGGTNRQVCRLKMPSRVPFGFHGQFISGEELIYHYHYHEELDKQFSCPIKWIRFFIRDFIVDFSQALDWCARKQK